MFYCYNMHPNPRITDFLGCHNDTFSDDFALTEMVQVIWRMAIRQPMRQQPITVVFASKRMRDIFWDWLNSVEGGVLRAAA
jgi:hypothetical protein